MKHSRLKEVEMNIGDRLFVSYMIQYVDVRDQKNGGKFMVLNIADQDVVLNGVKIFGVSENMIQKIVAGKVYAGAIDVKEYQGAASYIVYNIDELADANVEDYVTYEPFYNEAKEELMADIKALPDRLGLLVHKCIALTGNKFWDHSAAKAIHHSNLGGLVVHSNEVNKIACSIVENMNSPKLVNIGVVSASAILHDIGKCLELNTDRTTGVTEYDALANLEGHISIGVRILEEAVRDIRANGVEIDANEVRAIRHCILSHHGKLEYGSPVMPSAIEAVIVSHADMLSYELFVMKKAMMDLDENCAASLMLGSERRKVVRCSGLEM